MNQNYFKKMLDDYDKGRKSHLFLETAGFRVLMNYVKVIIVQQSFQQTIMKMRNKYKISPSGYPLIGNGPWNHPPKEWVYYGNRKFISEIRTILKKICVEYFLLPTDWLTVFEDILFYHVIHITLEPNSYNLCFVSDSRTKTDSRGIATSKEDVDAFPITLHISPYASKRNILDYIGKIYKSEINLLQMQYRDPKSKIGKYKTKDKTIARRDFFIFLNRNLSRNNLIELVNSRFPKNTLDSADIGKIISLETKRRKEM